MEYNGHLETSCNVIKYTQKEVGNENLNNKDNLNHGQQLKRTRRESMMETSALSVSPCTSP